MKELIEFRSYVQEELTSHFKNIDVLVDEISFHERKGNFYYRIYAWIDNKLCIGTGSSQGKAIDDAMSSYVDYLGDNQYFEVDN